VETVSDTLIERIHELRTREPILSTTPKEVAIASLLARMETLEDAVLMLNEAVRELAKLQQPDTLKS
jgi:sulfur relay (sulfurtransferase) DsrF/TusC family protein